MQYEITGKGPLLNDRGSVREPGWSRRILLDYTRSAIRVNKLKIKEWDYYIVNDSHYGLALTIADNGYMGLVSASLLDFQKGWEHTSTVMEAFPLGKYNMPATSGKGDIIFERSGLSMRFIKSEGKRQLILDYTNFHEGKSLIADLTLSEPLMDTMVIATPFNKPKHFYYNQKINCMPAAGIVKWGERNIQFSPSSAFGTLDWGRGVWTYDNTWYWGSANGIINEKCFGFNIGYGFGDTSRASENVIHYDGKAHKLNDVKFNIPKDSYMKPWTFTSSDGRFEMDFVPVLDRAAHTNALIIESDQHQVFGKFTGEVMLDDGSELFIDNLLGFAEKVRNRY